jgi:hypothetical protein
MSSQAIISVKAPVDAVRATLIGFGATLHRARSVVFVFGDDLIVVAHEKIDLLTTILIVGPDASSTGNWLIAQLEDLGWTIDHVDGLSDK